MAKKNNDQIGSGLELLRKALAPYIKRQLKAVYKDNWWKNGADPHVSRMPELKTKLSKAKDEGGRMKDEFGRNYVYCSRSWLTVMIFIPSYSFRSSK